jgi:hypothetical protein
MQKIAKPMKNHQVFTNSQEFIRSYPFDFKVSLAWMLPPLLCLMFLCSTACAIAPTNYYAGQTYKFTTSNDPAIFDFYWTATCCGDEDCCMIQLAALIQIAEAIQELIPTHSFGPRQM